MGFIENMLINGEINDSRLIAKWGTKLIGKSGIILSREEQQLSKGYLWGYHLLQQSADWDNERYHPMWRFMKYMPIYNSVVNAARLQSRVAAELIDETSDLEIIYIMGGIMEKSELRNLANLLSTTIVRHSSKDEHPDEYLPFDEIKTKCLKIIERWRSIRDNQ